MTNKVLAAIPVFNETDVSDIVKRVNGFCLDVLVVDDGSTNGLHTELKNLGGVHVITHQKNLGYGKAIIDAFAFSIKNGYEYLLTLDGDGQHEPEEVSLFLKEIPFYDCDILSGSRYYFGAKTGNEFPQERYLINKEITGMVNRITGFNITDAFCGFKAYKVGKLKPLRMTEHGYGMPLQLWLQAWKSGLRVREIPVKLIYKDLAKQFNGILRDPVVRLNYYKNIIEKEAANTAQSGATALKTGKRVKFS